MKHALALSASLALLATAACGNVVTRSAAGTTGGGGTGTTGTGVGASDVTGTLIDRYHGEAPAVAAPSDLSGAKVEALVWDGGAWSTFPGKGGADGSFTIPGVPDGLFMAHVAGTYLYTTARTLDLGREIVGRPGAVPSTGNARLAGDLQNLDPWQGDDLLAWFSANAGGAGSGPDTAVSAGATSLSGATATWFGGLVDGSKGDTLYATELSAQQVNGVEVLTVSRFLALGGVQQADGAVTTVSGTLAAVSADQTLTVDFRASEFAKLGPSVLPGAGSFLPALQVITSPGATTVGLVGPSADLFALSSSADVTLGPVAYANPFPAVWGTMVLASEVWIASYTAPGASTPIKQYASVYVSAPLGAAVAGPIVPLVSPVQGVTVDGASAFGKLAGISTTPVLAWSLPAIGAPTGYRVLVYQVSNAGGASVMTLVAEIPTTTTSLPLPPDLLQKGSGYVFCVEALVSSNDAATAPFRHGTSSALAEMLTTMAVP